MTVFTLLMLSSYPFLGNIFRYLLLIALSTLRIKVIAIRKSIQFFIGFISVDGQSLKIDRDNSS